MIKDYFRKQATSLFFFLKTRTYKSRLKYLYERKGSKKLVISFTAFSDKPCFNYYRTLKPIKVDKLFLQDNFGYTGSYLLYENGDDLPRRLTMGLLNKIISNNHYDEIVTLGTSKGGADSIIYGLEIGASEIFSGANQYFIGKYLNTDEGNRRKVFLAMMGEKAGIKEQTVLDTVMPDLFIKHKDAKSFIHVLYSKKEHTYDDHIKDMITDLEKTNIKFIEIEENFEDHNDVWRYFIPYILKHIN